MSNKSNSIKYKFIAALALTAAFGAMIPEAEACGGGWWPGESIQEIDYRPFGIAMAEKQLEGGKADDAAATVLRVIPHIQSYKTAVKDEVINRGLRVLAVAAARSNGEVDVAKQLDPYQREFISLKRDAKLSIDSEWTVAALRALADRNADDAVAQSELGEALASSAAHRDEGRQLLEKLAEKDLLTSPEAYKALATLRAVAGNEDGRIAALERCKAMAKDAAFCTTTS
jgi:hypothetical protein